MNRLSDLIYFIDAGMGPRDAWRAVTDSTRPLRFPTGRGHVLRAALAFLALACVIAGVIFIRNH